MVINQKGIIKTVIPEITLRFDDDMIVLEKWDPNKPVSAIYWEGDKELFYVKRFIIENPDREEMIISDHPKSYLEKVFVDYRPMFEVLFAKKRGKDRQENIEINLEEFISIKGVSALGNQLTKDKILEINALDPLPYEVPDLVLAEEIDVVDEETIPSGKETNISEEESNNDSPSKPEKGDDPISDDEGQTLLF